MIAVLDGVDLRVDRGGVSALLGPNGAGKTTAVRVFATLLRPDGGRAVVAGPTWSAAGGGAPPIGLTGQYAALDDYLTGPGQPGHDRPADASSPGGGPAPGRRTARPLRPARGAAGRAVKTYSGGMRRRLDLAASLIGQPGCCSWRADHRAGPAQPGGHVGIIRELAAEGTTLLLTTQYLEEADAAGETGSR